MAGVAKGLRTVISERFGPEAVQGGIFFHNLSEYFDVCHLQERNKTSWWPCWSRKRTSAPPCHCWRRSLLRGAENFAGCPSSPLSFNQWSVATGAKTRLSIQNDYLASLFCFRDYTNFCKERNIVGNSKGFLQRILSADCVVTPEKCQKYFLSCERYHKLLSNDVK